MKVEVNKYKWNIYADSNKIPKTIAHSPIDGVLFKYNLPPVFFWKFYYLASILWIQFSVFYWLIMYFWVWKDKAIIISILVSIVVGFFFGISMSSFIVWRRRKWDIKWEDVLSS